MYDSLLAKIDSLTQTIANAAASADKASTQQDLAVAIDEQSGALLQIQRDALISELESLQAEARTQANEAVTSETTALSDAATISTRASDIQAALNADAIAQASSTQASNAVAAALQALSDAQTAEAIAIAEAAEALTAFNSAAGVQNIDPAVYQEALQAKDRAEEASDAATDAVADTQASYDAAFEAGVTATTEALASATAITDAGLTQAVATAANRAAAVTAADGAEDLSNDDSDGDPDTGNALLFDDADPSVDITTLEGLIASATTFVSTATTSATNTAGNATAANAELSNAPDAVDARQTTQAAADAAQAAAATASGVAQVDTVTLDGAVDLDDAFTVNVGLDTVTYTVDQVDIDAGFDINDVRDALVADINADPDMGDVVAAVSTTNDGQLTLTAINEGVAFATTASASDGNTATVATTTASLTGTSQVSQVDTVKVIDTTEGYTYTLTISSNSVAYEVQNGDTAVTIRDALITLVNTVDGSLDGVVTAAAQAGTTDGLTLTSDTPGVAFTAVMVVTDGNDDSVANASRVDTTTANLQGADDLAVEAALEAESQADIATDESDNAQAALAKAVVSLAASAAATEAVEASDDADPTTSDSIADKATEAFDNAQTTVVGDPNGDNPQTTLAALADAADDLGLTYTAYTGNAADYPATLTSLVTAFNDAAQAEADVIFAEITDLATALGVSVPTTGTLSARADTISADLKTATAAISGDADATGVAIALIDDADDAIDAWVADVKTADRNLDLTGSAITGAEGQVDLAFASGPARDAANISANNDAYDAAEQDATSSDNAAQLSETEVSTAATNVLTSAQTAMQAATNLLNAADDFEVNLDTAEASSLAAVTTLGTAIGSLDAASASTALGTVLTDLNTAIGTTTQTFRITLADAVETGGATFNLTFTDVDENVVVVAASAAADDFATVRTDIIGDLNGVTVDTGVTITASNQLNGVDLINDNELIITVSSTTDRFDVSISSADATISETSTEAALNALINGLTAIKTTVDALSADISDVEDQTDITEQAVTDIAGQAAGLTTAHAIPDFDAADTILTTVTNSADAAIAAADAAADVAAFSFARESGAEQGAAQVVAAEVQFDQFITKAQVEAELATAQAAEAARAVAADDDFTGASDDTDEDTSILLDVLANDVRADGGSLINPALIAVGAAGNGTVEIVSQVDDVTIDDTGGLNFDGSTGNTIVLFLNANDPNDSTFTFSVVGTDLTTLIANLVDAINADADASDIVEAGGATATGFTLSAEISGTPLTSIDPADGTTVLSKASVTAGSGSEAQTVATSTANGLVRYTPDENYNGTDSFDYTVSNNDPDAPSFSTASVDVGIAAVNDAPEATDDLGTAATEISPVTIDLLANDEDIDGDSLSVTVIDDLTITVATADTGDFPTPASSSVDGDNTTLTYALGAPSVDGIVSTYTTDLGVLVDNGDGTIVFTAGAGVFQSLGEGEEETIEFGYTLSDGVLTDTAAIAITITGTNDAPVAVGATANSNADPVVIDTDEDTQITGTVDATDTDNDSGDLSFTLAAGGLPANGAVTIDSAGNFTYTPDDDFNGSDTFTFRVQDTDGLFDTQEITVNIAAVNDAPDTEDDTASTNANAAVTISALANDNDLEGDSLTITFVDSQAITDGGAAITLSSGEGDVELIDGNLKFTPNEANSGIASLGAGESVDVSFSYTASDGTDTSPGNVTVSVGGANDAPVASDDTATVFANSAIIVDVLSNDTDADSGTVLSLLTASGAAKGTLVFNPQYDLFSLPSDSLSPSFDGEATAGDVFQITISGDVNGIATSAVVTFTVVSGEEPADSEAIHILIGEAINSDATASTIVHAEGNSSFIALASANSNGTFTTTVQLTDFETGEISSSPVSTSILTNQLLYAPDPSAVEGLGVGDSTTDTITYQVSDGETADEGELVITIDGINDAPVAADDTFATAADDGSVNFSVLNNDDDPDDNEDAVSLIVSTTSGFEPTSSLGATVTAFESAATAQVDTITIGGTVEDGDVYRATINGTTVSYTVSGDTTVDDVAAGLAAAIEVDTTVKDLVAAVGVGSGGQLTITASTAGQEFALSVSAANGGATNDGTIITANTTPSDAGGGITYDPSGVAALTALAQGDVLEDTVTYYAEDASGELSLATLTVNITGVNDAPTANDDGTFADPLFTTFENGTAVQIDVLANDTDPDTGDTAKFLVLSAVSELGATITNIEAVGAIMTYNASGLAGIEGLAEGETLVDTITYTMSDQGADGTSTAQSFVAVTGVNDAPDVVADAADADENGASIVINILGNDNDVDSDDDASTLTLVSAVSDSGATVTPVTQALVAQIDNVVLAGTLEDGDIYTIDIDGLRIEHVVNVASDVDLPGLAANIATEVNAAIANFNANNDGGRPDIEVIASDDSGGTIVLTATEDGNPFITDAFTEEGDGNATDDLSATVVLVTENSPETAISYDPNSTAAFEFLADGETTTDTITYVVVDSHGAQSTGTAVVTITGTNDGPVANDDARGVLNTDVLVVSAANGLFSNDTDPDASDTLSLFFTTPPPTSQTDVVTLTGTIEAGDEYSISVGDETFTYTVIGDEVDLSGLATAMALAFVGTLLDGELNVVVGSDPESLELTAQIPTANLFRTTITAVNNGATDDNAMSLVRGDIVDNSDGTFSLLTPTYAALVVINAADGSYTYDPSGITEFESASATNTIDDVFTYETTDPFGATSLASVTISVGGSNNVGGVQTFTLTPVVADILVASIADDEITLIGAAESNDSFDGSDGFDQLILDGTVNNNINVDDTEYVLGGSGLDTIDMNGSSIVNTTIGTSSKVIARQGGPAEFVVTGTTSYMTGVYTHTASSSSNFVSSITVTDEYGFTEHSFVSHTIDAGLGNDTIIFNQLASANALSLTAHGHAVASAGYMDVILSGGEGNNTIDVDVVALAKATGDLANGSKSHDSSINASATVSANTIAIGNVDLSFGTLTPDQNLLLTKNELLAGLNYTPPTSATGTTIDIDITRVTLDTFGQAVETENGAWLVDLHQDDVAGSTYSGSYSSEGRIDNGIDIDLNNIDLSVNLGFIRTTQTTSTTNTLSPETANNAFRVAGGLAGRAGDDTIDVRLAVQATATGHARYIEATDAFVESNDILIAAGDGANTVDVNLSAAVKATLTGAVVEKSGSSVYASADASDATVSKNLIDISGGIYTDVITVNLNAKGTAATSNVSVPTGISPSKVYVTASVSDIDVTKNEIHVDPGVGVGVNTVDINLSVTGNATASKYGASAEGKVSRNDITIASAGDPTALLGTLNADNTITLTDEELLDLVGYDPSLYSVSKLEAEDSDGVNFEIGTKQQDGTWLVNADGLLEDLVLEIIYVQDDAITPNVQLGTLTGTLGEEGSFITLTEDETLTAAGQSLSDDISYIYINGDFISESSPGEFVVDASNILDSNLVLNQYYTPTTSPFSFFPGLTVLETGIFTEYPDNDVLASANLVGGDGNDSLSVDLSAKMNAQGGTDASVDSAEIRYNDVTIVAGEGLNTIDVSMTVSGTALVNGTNVPASSYSYSFADVDVDSAEMEYNDIDISAGDDADSVTIDLNAFGSAVGSIASFSGSSTYTGTSAEADYIGFRDNEFTIDVGNGANNVDINVTATAIASVISGRASAETNRGSYNDFFVEAGLGADTITFDYNATMIANGGDADVDANWKYNLISIDPGTGTATNNVAINFSVDGDAVSTNDDASGEAEVRDNSVHVGSRELSIGTFTDDGRIRFTEAELRSGLNADTVDTNFNIRDVNFYDLSTYSSVQASNGDWLVRTKGTKDDLLDDFQVSLDVSRTFTLATPTISGATTSVSYSSISKALAVNQGLAGGAGADTISLNFNVAIDVTGVASAGAGSTYSSSASARISEAEVAYSEIEIAAGDGLNTIDLTMAVSGSARLSGSNSNTYNIASADDIRITNNEALIEGGADADTITVDFDARGFASNNLTYLGTNTYEGIRAEADYVGFAYNELTIDAGGGANLVDVSMIATATAIAPDYRAIAENTSGDYNDITVRAGTDADTVIVNLSHNMIATGGTDAEVDGEWRYNFINVDPGVGTGVNNVDISFSIDGDSVSANGDATGEAEIYNNTVYVGSRQMSIGSTTADGRFRFSESELLSQFTGFDPNTIDFTLTSVEFPGTGYADVRQEANGDWSFRTNGEENNFLDDFNVSLSLTETIQNNYTTATGATSTYSTTTVQTNHISNILSVDRSLTGGAGDDTISVGFTANIRATGATRAYINEAEASYNDVVIAAGEGINTIDLTMNMSETAILNGVSVTDNYVYASADDARIRQNEADITAGDGNDTVTIDFDATGFASADATFAPTYSSGTQYAEADFVGFEYNDLSIDVGGGTNLVDLSMVALATALAPTGRAEAEATQGDFNEIRIDAGTGADIFILNFSHTVLANGGTYADVEGDWRYNIVHVDPGAGAGVNTVDIDFAIDGDAVAALGRASASGEMDYNNVLVGSRQLSVGTFTADGRIRFTESELTAGLDTVDFTITGLSFSGSISKTSISQTTAGDWLVATKGSSSKNILDDFSVNLSISQTQATPTKSYISDALAVTQNLTGGLGNDSLSVNMDMALNATGATEAKINNIQYSYNEIDIGAGDGTNTIDVTLGADLFAKAQHVGAVSTYSSYSATAGVAISRVSMSYNEITVDAGNGADSILVDLSVVATANADIAGSFTYSSNSVTSSVNSGVFGAVVGSMANSSNVVEINAGDGINTIDVLLTLDATARNLSTPVNSKTLAVGAVGFMEMDSNTIDVSGGADTDDIDVILSMSASAQGEDIAAAVFASLGGNDIGVDAGEGTNLVNIDLIQSLSATAPNGVAIANLGSLPTASGTVTFSGSLSSVNSYNDISVAGGSGQDTVTIDLSSTLTALGDSVANVGGLVWNSSEILVDPGTGTGVNTVDINVTAIGSAVASEGGASASGYLYNNDVTVGSLVEVTTTGLTWDNTGQTPAESTNTAMTPPTAQVTDVVFTGTYAAGDQYTIQIDGGTTLTKAATGTTDLATFLAEGGFLDAVVANAPGVDSYTINADGFTLTGTAASAFSITTLTVSGGGFTGVSDTDSTTYDAGVAASDTVSLMGTPAVGDIYDIAVEGQLFQATVDGSTIITADDIVADLAAQITAALSGTLTATASANDLTVTAVDALTDFDLSAIELDVLNESITVSEADILEALGLSSNESISVIYYGSESDTSLGMINPVSSDFTFDTSLVTGDLHIGQVHGSFDSIDDAPLFISYTDDGTPNAPYQLVSNKLSGGSGDDTISVDMSLTLNATGATLASATTGYISSNDITIAAGDGVNTVDVTLAAVATALVSNTLTSKNGIYATAEDVYLLSNNISVNGGSDTDTILVDLSASQQVTADVTFTSEVAIENFIVSATSGYAAYNEVSIDGGDGLNDIDVLMHVDLSAIGQASTTGSNDVQVSASITEIYLSYNDVDIAGGDNTDDILVDMSLTARAEGAYSALISYTSISATSATYIYANEITVDAGDGANTVDIDLAYDLTAIASTGSAYIGYSSTTSNNNFYSNTVNVIGGVDTDVITIDLSASQTVQGASYATARSNLMASNQVTVDADDGTNTVDINLTVAGNASATGSYATAYAIIAYNSITVGNLVTTGTTDVLEGGEGGDTISVDLSASASASAGQYANAKTAYVYSNDINIAAGDGLNTVDVTLAASASASVTNTSLDESYAYAYATDGYVYGNSVTVSGGIDTDTISVDLTASGQATADVTFATSVSHGSAYAYANSNYVRSNEITVDGGDGLNTVDVTMLVDVSANNLTSYVNTGTSETTTNISPYANASYDFIKSNTVNVIGGIGSDDILVDMTINANASAEYSADVNSAYIQSNSVTVDAGSGANTVTVNMVVNQSAIAAIGQASVNGSYNSYNDVDISGGTGADTVTVNLSQTLLASGGRADVDYAKWYSNDIHVDPGLGTGAGESLLNFICL